MCREELFPPAPRLQAASSAWCPPLLCVLRCGHSLPLWSQGLPTPTKVVNRQKSIDGGRAAHSSGVTAAGRAPQACGIVGGPPEGSAMEVSTVSPRQPSTIPVTEISPAGERVGTVEGAQPVLAGPEGLPARGRGQGLTLCKETTDLLFTGKLSENSSVPQHTPGEGEAHVRTQRPEAPRDSSGNGTSVSRTHQAPSTPPASLHEHVLQNHAPGPQSWDALGPPDQVLQEVSSLGGRAPGWRTEQPTYMCRDFCAFTTSSFEL